MRFSRLMFGAFFLVARQAYAQAQPATPAATQRADTTPAAFNAVAVTPDGTTAAALDGAGQLHLFDPSVGARRLSVRAHDQKGLAVAASPDGRTVAGPWRLPAANPFTLAAYAGPKGTIFRPSHIHFSLFGRTLSERLVTQCYFAGDPLIEHDPVVLAIPDPAGRERLIAQFDAGTTPLTSGGETSALAYTWDIVLRGPQATPVEDRS